MCYFAVSFHCCSCRSKYKHKVLIMKMVWKLFGQKLNPESLVWKSSDWCIFKKQIILSRFKFLSQNTSCWTYDVCKTFNESVKIQHLSDNFDSKTGEKRDQDNMIDRPSFRAICSIRFELENSNFEFLFLLNPRYDANSDRFCEFLKSNFHQKSPIFIKSNYFKVDFEEMA